MAETEDPFEAAMASMGEDDKNEGDENPHTDKDPFASGEVAAGGNEVPQEEKTETDPFEAAMEAMEAASDGGSESEGSQSPKAADPFEAAMQAMDAGEDVNTAIVEADDGDDPFAAALEVAKTQHKVAAAQKTTDADAKDLDIDFLMEIKLNLTFEVGRTKMYISDLLSLGQGSVIELHRLVGEELELYVNGQLLATGEVVVVNEKFGARITKILSPEERISQMGPQVASV